MKRNGYPTLSECLFSKMKSQMVSLQSTTFVFPAEPFAVGFWTTCLSLYSVKKMMACSNSWVLLTYFDLYLSKPSMISCFTIK